ncbi:MAG: sigma 54-interacting transcriptional regulator [Woeseiaceae bacterium]
MVSLFSKKHEGVPFESFIGDVSMRLLRTDGAEPNASIQPILEKIGERYGADIVSLRWAPAAESGSEDGEFEMVAGWQRTGGPLKQFAASEVPWCLARIRDGEIVRIDNLDELPREAAADCVALRTRGVEAGLILGLTVDEDILGAFSLAMHKPFHWSDTTANEFQILGAILSNYYWSINNRAKLRDSEARYRGVVQDQTDLIFRWTPHGIITWANDRFFKYLDTPRKAIIGKEANWLKSGPDWPRVKANVAKLSPKNPFIADEHEDTLPNGKRVWQEWVDRGIFDDEGNLLEVQSVGRDITARKQAEATLLRQADFQRRLATISSYLLSAQPEDINGAISDSVARIGIDYGFDRAIVRWHDDALAGFGVPKRWIKEGLPVATTNPEDFPHSYKALRSGMVYRVDDVEDMPPEAHIDQESLRRRGLRSIYCLPLIGEEKVLGFLTVACLEKHTWDEATVDELQLIAHAITSAAVRQWSMIQLSQREKDLARSQSVARVGSYRLQATRNEDDDSPNMLNVLSLTMSDQALEIFGISEQQDARAQVYSLLAQIHPDDEPRVREQWRKTLESGSEHTIEYRVLHPGGAVVHVQAREQFDGVDNNGVITFFGTYKDITEWVQANQKLQVALSEIEQLRDQLQEENLMLRDEVRAAHGFDTIIGNSQELRSVLDSAGKVAPTDVTVLICGETGTGKELIARSIHDLSHRKDKPMVSVNCAALSADLIESELFGHEKGAFTGAQEQRKGRFELANGGTLFLDEIGEISGDLQAKLLRVIQEGEFERLGGSTTLKTDVRLIAATNRDLVQAMDRGEFRADLYYRINSFPIELPPLRERKEDIPILAQYFIQKHAKTLGKNVESISARTLRYFQEQDWPGNIRELESAILRALISTTGPVLDFLGGRNLKRSETDGGDAAMSLLDAQHRHIVDVLKRTGWVIEGKNGAASALGLAPSSLRSKMKRLNIVRPERREQRSSVT